MKKPKFRPASLIPLAAIALLAALSWWLLQATRQAPAAPPPQALTHTPDYFADNFSVSELDQSGLTQYRLSATHMVHYEDDENSDLTLPAVRAFEPGKPVTTATGQRGTVNSDASIVDLYGQAHIVRAADADNPQMQASSEHFRVFVNDDVILTKNPVKLQRGPSIMTATSGMHYDNVTRVIQLYGNVRGFIAPPDAGGKS